MYKENYENILGNCDTQVFLGSQSIKTCEYISKSLGQKTIKIESKSKNRDKDNLTTQGISLSEQRQGRELMTIDELKRLPSDDEIILVRGLKPIKAKKAWYYKYHPMREEARRYEIHNISEMPKTEDVEVCVMDVQKHINDRMRKAKEVLNKRQEVEVPDIDVGDKQNFDIDLGDKKEETNKVNQVIATSKEEMLDLQKELEKKFDEIFGSTSDTVE